MKFIGVLVTNDIHERLRKISEKYNTSVVEVMRDIIADFLKVEENKKEE